MSDRIPALRRVLDWAAPHARQSAGPEPQAKRINLALQGGGAHGAFTWGVLDRLLADGRIAVDGLTGTSAGAVNAVILASGLARGGPEDARARLAAFWRAASGNGNLSTLQRDVLDRMFPFMPLRGSPVNAWFDALTQLWSPQELNPLNINPLKDLIARFVDFDALHDSGRPIFIAATDVQTGALRIFPREEITPDAVMASACLPLLFRPVEIDGVPYWDGGYTGNPALAPFLTSTSSEDVLLVQINPLVRHKAPSSTRDVMNRINEVSFNSALLSELQTIAFTNRMIDEARLPHGFAPGEYRRVRMHRIVLEDPSERLDADSKLNTDFEFFQMLHGLGAQAAQQFLDAHFDNIGVRATIEDVGQPAEA